MKGLEKPVRFTEHTREKMLDRGVLESEALEAIRVGMREPARRGLWQYRLNVEYRRMWCGKLYGLKQVVPIVAEESESYVVVTAYAFYFQEGHER